MPYKDPDKKRASNREYMARKRAKDPEGVRAYQRAYNQTEPARTKGNVRSKAYYKSTVVFTRKTANGKEQRKLEGVKYRNKDRAAYNEKNRLYLRQKNVERRTEIVAFLGGKCNHCSITDPRVLQIDHVNGGGHKEWKNVHLLKKYKMVNEFPERYQLLCANCNWIKRHENNEVRRVG